MSSAVKAKRGLVVSLQGPRPLPLDVSPPRASKRPRVVAVGGDDGDVGEAVPAAGPVIVYEHTPIVIHARPDEFKALVQRLTGRGGDQEEPMLRPAETAPEEATATAAAGAGDPLVLTLGQRVPPPPLRLFDECLPSPGAGGAGGFLLSPGGFLFSPATMQAIHELIS